MSTNQIADPLTMAYLARKGVALQWRGFLRALVETLDANMEPDTRDALLRAVGARMAQLAPMPACGTLAELESRMNDVLAAADWGFVQLALDNQARALLLTHSAPPMVATHHDATGGWISAVLEGLYAAWLAAQPGAEGNVPLRRQPTAVGSVVLRFGR